MYKKEVLEESKEVFFGRVLSKFLGLGELRAKSLSVGRCFEAECADT